MGIIYLFAAVYLMAFTGFGLAISSVSSTQQQAMFTAFFFMIIFVLLSGMFTPVSSMPVWAQELTRVNPLRYLVEVMRMVYLKGSTLSDLTGHFIAVCLFALFFNVLAIVSYKKRRKLKVESENTNSDAKHLSTFTVQLSPIMCFTTYLTIFYKLPAFISSHSSIFDSNLKQYFKYGKRYSKYGKSRRELQGSESRKRDRCT